MCTATVQIENLLLELGLPTIRVVDLVWTGDEFRTLVDALGLEHCRPMALLRSPRAGLGAFRGVVSGYISDNSPRDLLVFMCAATTRDWKERVGVLGELTIGIEGLTFCDLGKELRPTVALEKLAATLAAALRPGQVVAAPEEPDDPPDRTLLRGLQKLTGCEDPLIVVVCGVPETQGKAAEDFPEKLRAETGIQGKWIFTDYRRPERVVDELKLIAEREGSRLALVIFSQRRNATNAKRDGMAALRDRGIQVAAPDFKSCGSAIAAAREVAQRMVNGLDADG